MNVSNVLKIGIMLELVCVVVMLYTISKPNYVSSFNVSSADIAKDMDGRAVHLPYGQVWPFDPTQSLTVRVVAKKQVEEYVIVLVEVSAQAEVMPTTKDTKEIKDSKEKGKLPARVKLNGNAKLTYESIGKQWNLVSIDNVSLRASPAD